MQHTIILTKKLIIFYTILGIPIAIASFDNLVYGIILRQNANVGLGAFSIGGFILLPILIWASYRNNKCTLTLNSIKIGKTEYPYSAYKISIHYVDKTFSERPFVSLWKKTYPELVITDLEEENIFYECELSISKKELALLEKSIP